MKISTTDFNILASKIAEQRSKKQSNNMEYPAEHYLMLVIQALAEAVGNNADAPVEVALPDYEKLNEDMSRGFDTSYHAHIAGTPFDCLAVAAMRILDLYATRGIKICALDNQTINMAPIGFASMPSYTNLSSFIYDLVCAVNHRQNEDCAIFECLKISEKNPQDTELKKVIDEYFGAVESREDLEIRTVYGFENYLIAKSLMPVLISLAAWFKLQGGKNLVWHINARMYYETHFE